MQCPHCGEADTRVIDSRDLGHAVRRRRLCERCNTRFTTQEHTQARDLFVIKKDGRREPFSRDKVLTGVRKACEKRPLPTGAVEKLVDDLESEVYGLGKAEVTSYIIGDMVMQRLRDLDNIAYIRFASVYRDFTDITDFKKAVDTLVEDKPSKNSTSQLPLLPEGETLVPSHRLGRRLVAGARKGS